MSDKLTRVAIVSDDRVRHPIPTSDSSSRDCEELQEWSSRQNLADACSVNLRNGTGDETHCVSLANHQSTGVQAFMSRRQDGKALY